MLSGGVGLVGKSSIYSGNKTLCCRRVFCDGLSWKFDEKCSVVLCGGEQGTDREKDVNYDSKSTQELVEAQDDDLSEAFCCCSAHHLALLIPLPPSAFVAQGTLQVNNRAANNNNSRPPSLRQSNKQVLSRTLSLNPEVLLGRDSML